MHYNIEVQMNTISLVVVLIISVIFLFRVSTALIDTIDASQSLTDGNTIISKDGSFEVGFFTPDGSTKRYLGIWYGNIPVKTVVWVANRNNPINDSSGLLTINTAGNPVILSQSQNRTVVVWSAIASSNLTKDAKDPVLQLLDTGNLILRDKIDAVSSEIYLWESFDHPCDTLLPGMKLGWDLKRGINRYLTSWKSSNDPSIGDFKWEVELENNPQVVMWKGADKLYTGGPWIGSSFSGNQNALRPNSIFTYNFISNENEVYYIYNLKNSSLFTRIVMNQTTYLRVRYTWNDVEQSWKESDAVPRDRCDNYGLCGVYGNCKINEFPVCQCLKGFSPKSLERWYIMDWSQGCVRNKPLNCEKGDAFARYDRLKLPDPSHSWVSKTMKLSECRAKCLQNCSCMAYSYADFRGRGSGCTIWFNDLVDFKQFSDGPQHIYIRLSSSEIEKAMPTTKIAAIVCASIALFCGILLISFYIKRRNAKRFAENTSEIYQNKDDCQSEEMELPIFELRTIVNATNNFSMENKIGEGGFGTVFRGTLTGGLEIAVKKQSIRSSGQGLSEFKTEVLLISKLQHRNLVKLLGCCIQGEDKILVYEYMPNGSLDSFIFAQNTSKLLDWATRYNIICGIARGLLYLHQDSRLRIIHRDLKASNILLDEEMNPKISDFGMAKTFGGEQTEGSTNRVVGTYGYMAPEYASDGTFSIKSDVFSFGILVLEIVSGKRNRGFYHPDHSEKNLIGHAWELWKEGRSPEFVDSFLGESCNLSQALRCIHISLLCVQQHADERPSMASVILMLGSEISLPEPKEPGFLKDKGPLKFGFSSSYMESMSSNDMSFSLNPR